MNVDILSTTDRDAFTDFYMNMGCAPQICRGPVVGST